MEQLSNPLKKTAQWSEFMMDFVHGVKKRVFRSGATYNDLEKYIIQKCMKAEERFGRAKEQVFDDLWDHPDFRRYKVMLSLSPETVQFIKQSLKKTNPLEGIKENRLTQIRNKFKFLKTRMEFEAKSFVKDAAFGGICYWVIFCILMYLNVIPARSSSVSWGIGIFLLAFITYIVIAGIKQPKGKL